MKWKGGFNMKKIIVVVCLLMVALSGCKSKSFSDMTREEQNEYLEKKFDSGE